MGGLKNWNKKGGAAATVALERGTGVTALPTADPGLRGYMIRVDKVEPNPHQPRQWFEPEAMEQLAASIDKKGLMQPIVVAPKEDGETYELVAGERRWRAHQILGREKIWAVYTRDKHAAALALMENTQRRDLLPLETASALADLVSDLDMARGDVGRMFGFSKYEVSRFLTIAKLPQEIRDDYFASDEGRAVSLAALYEVARCTGDDLQTRVWEAAKGGAAVARLRSMREPAKGGAPAPADPAKVVKAMTRSVAKTRQHLGTLAEHRDHLTEDHRNELVALRQEIDRLLD